MSIVTAPPTGPGDAPAAGGPGSPALPDAPWRTTWRRLWGDRGSRTALIAAALLILVALTAPLLSRLGGWSPTAFDADAIDPYLGGLPHGALGGISADHWLGVEPVTGRDLFARVVHGAQVSLLIAFAATAIVVVTGTAAGIAAGYFGGRVDTVLSRLMDLTMSFPSLIFMIAMMSVAQDVNRVVLMTVVIGVFGWPGIARVVRAEALSLRHREFVEAARACGSGPWRILTRQVLPNISGPVIAYTTLLIPGMISTEAALSFLGVGVRPPTPSWGQMIAEAVAYYETDPMYFIVPSVFLFVAVLAFTVLGDALRDILDPQGGRP
ncbi:ABC transporter permease [Streptomyces anulatus]|uniref:ABC transporter permease n=1 Tax=Streptomyces anulatus TaxID=1892 RepID=UPI00067BEE95|nr:ABC transporter permease [Streptomyces anulatus]KND37827.1 peptide ABC transporter permease [Streptomyces europaeiscabiei]MDF9807271.1 peptide/nickel transport system permease protein [Streptomyces sp. HB372]WSR79046.1 ABC transporter permease [Streptomyces anulatus]WTC62565.1 ABC transporter permease [Streptomyces anulatus]WTC74381.1 ABC transporter permease [Streptomyces anulatus]